MDIELVKQCGAALAHMRHEAGMTQKELAASLGVPQSYVSKVERGERSLKVYEQFSYARALGIPTVSFVQRLESWMNER